MQELSAFVTANLIPSHHTFLSSISSIFFFKINSCLYHSHLDVCAFMRAHMFLWYKQKERTGGKCI